jgi:hypothetical protein
VAAHRPPGRSTGRAVRSPLTERPERSPFNQAFTQVTGIAIALTGALVVLVATGALAAHDGPVSALVRALVALALTAVWALTHLPFAVCVGLWLITRNRFRKQTAMPGYSGRVVTLRFPELTAEGDPEIHVAIRNPRLIPLDLLQPRDIDLGPDGRPVNMEDAKLANNEVLAKLVIGWRVYDASDVSVDADGNELDQAPLPLPATPDAVAKLPTAIFTAITREVTEAMDPK